MKFAIDLMGGDNAPEAILAAVRQSAKEHRDWGYLAVGLPQILSSLDGLPNVTTVMCGSVMAMDEDIRSLMSKKTSSIWIATELVKQGEADAVISAGSTGAQMVAATLLLSRVKGVSRPAIGNVMPTAEGGKLLLDIGANADCDPAMLLQFAQMGSVYAQYVLGIPHPRVALMSNGTEEHKGNTLTRAAYELIQKSGLRFVGNREGRDILRGGYDVMVADGMSGNVALKSMEGAAEYIMSQLKRELSAGLRTKLGAALIMKGLRRVKKSMDYQEYGGAPLLGVKGVSIVCHGSSRERAIYQAVEVAARCVESRFVEHLASAVRAIDEGAEDSHA